MFQSGAIWFCIFHTVLWTNRNRTDIAAIYQTDRHFRPDMLYHGPQYMYPWVNNGIVSCRKRLVWIFTPTATGYLNQWWIYIVKQECIPVGCILPAHWLYSIVSRRVCSTPPPPHLLDTDPPGCRAPECRPPGHMTSDACWEANPPVDRRNDTPLCKTLPFCNYCCRR